MVPTVDTVRVKFIASSLVRVGVHTLLVGGVGVGKTMMASSVLEGLPTGYGAININFSAQTSSNSLQDTIEGKLEKRTKVLITLLILNLHAAPDMDCCLKYMQSLQCCALMHLHALRNSGTPFRRSACRNTNVMSVIAGSICVCHRKATPMQWLKFAAHCNLLLSHASMYCCTAGCVWATWRQAPDSLH